ncbi:MAG: response regulator [Desulfuromonas sp.]|nr:response regulator [Desulfuromonas sp.]
MTKATILIVEDEAIIAADLAGKLGRLGYEISGTTGYGEEAVSQARERRPDLILMDIRLAGAMDGVDAATIIRRELDLPVIFLTAHSDQATLERAKLTGPFGYILKPFEERELATNIAMALYKHQAERKLRQAHDELEQRVEERTRELRDAEQALREINLTLEQRVAERTAELFAANATLRDARRAALNMMEDAIVARRQAEEASAERKQADEMVHRQNAILSGINRIFGAVLASGSEEELGETCLAVAEEITGSRFGFIGEFGEDGLLHGIAMSNPGWELCTIYDQAGERRPPSDFHIRGVYGRVLLDGKGFFTNEPSSHPDSIGTPAGHPPLTAFLGVSLVRDEEIIGMVALGNRDGGYGQVELEAMETLAPSIVESFQRMRMKKALGESELFYRQLLESIPGMVFTTRPDGYCDFQSQPWVDFTGVPMAEHLGDGWNRLLHPDDRPRAFAAWRDAVEERAPYDLEYRVRRHDGEYQWFKVCGRPIRNAGGEIVRWFGTALNIDQLVKLQEELLQAKELAEEASRAKSEFVANMSHEIRTPMTVFLMAIDQLLQINADPSSRQLLEMADKAAMALRGLVDDILDFSRIEAGSVEIADEPFNPVSAMREVIEMFDLAAREKNLRLTWDVSQDVPPIVFGDWFKIKQVLINLLGNALKFTPEGEIDVTVRPRGKQLVFVVADTGIGIPEDKCHLLFESFRQVDSSFHRQYGGSGLGLAICKGLVELMGGRIAVQGRNKGTIFSFTIPLKTPSLADLSSADPAAAEVARTTNHARILLADDDPMILEVMNLALTLRGWQTETAMSGAEAVEKWRHGDFNVILMDLQMPGMNGLEATRMIREQEVGKGSRTPIIGFTAHVEARILDDCHEAGMDRVLYKPVEIDALYVTIEQFLAD